MKLLAVNTAHSERCRSLIRGLDMAHQEVDGLGVEDEHITPEGHQRDKSPTSMTNVSCVVSNVVLFLVPILPETMPRQTAAPYMTASCWLVDLPCSSS